MIERKDFEEVLKSLSVEKKQIALSLLDDLIRIETELERCRAKPFIKYHPQYPSISQTTTEFMVYNKLLTQKNNLTRTLNNTLRNISSDDDSNPMEDFNKLFEEKFGVK